MGSHCSRAEDDRSLRTFDDVAATLTEGRGVSGFGVDRSKSISRDNNWRYSVIDEMGMLMDRIRVYWQTPLLRRLSDLGGHPIGSNPIMHSSFRINGLIGMRGGVIGLFVTPPVGLLLESDPRVVSYLSLVFRKPGRSYCKWLRRF